MPTVSYHETVILRLKSDPEYKAAMLKEVERLQNGTAEDQVVAKSIQDDIAESEAVPPKRLFDNRDRYTVEGRHFSANAGTSLQPLIQQWKRYGYSVRDLESILHNEVSTLCLQEL
jgi:hypothetical protein